MRRKIVGELTFEGALHSYNTTKYTDFYENKKVTLVFYKDR